MSMTTEQITAVVTPVAAVVIAWLQFGQRKQSKANGDKLDAVHALVNSNMGKQLLVAANLAQRVADLTKEPGDVTVAAEARKLYDAHMAVQSASDALSKNLGGLTSP
jgi:hypothetical protein